jgi:hypothetical protein
VNRNLQVIKTCIISHMIRKMTKENNSGPDLSERTDPVGRKVTIKNAAWNHRALYRICIVSVLKIGGFIT